MLEGYICQIDQKPRHGKGKKKQMSLKMCPQKIPKLKYKEKIRTKGNVRNGCVGRP